MPEKVSLTVVSLILPSFPTTILPEDSSESLSFSLDSQPSFFTLSRPWLSFLLFGF